MKRFSILLAIMASGLALGASAQEQQTPQTVQQQATVTPENAVENSKTGRFGSSQSAHESMEPP